MFDISFIQDSSQDNQDLWFRTEMTYRQFASLAYKLSTSDIENELINLDFFANRLEKAKKIDLKEIEKWLKNSWNTENVLRLNRTIIENTGQSFSMQWAFPQAYYAVFCSLIAHFKALGYTQESHTAVLKNFGVLVEQNKLPESICFYCTGGKKEYHYRNIVKPIDVSPMDFDLNNSKTIDNQICQFLKATRELKLEDKAPDLKFKTKTGAKRKKLSPAMWQKVSESIGNTTIIDLLYRKRIKANYQDIDTFSSNHFKGLEVLECLNKIVDRLNLINECYIAKAIGFDEYKAMVDIHLANINDSIVSTRIPTVESIVKAI